MYNGILDNLNRVVLIPMNNLTRRKFIQAGISEKGMLCSRCDNDLLGKLERYAAAVVYGGTDVGDLKITRAMGPDGVKSLKLENLDYSKFKLFILSILWRAHHSRNKFFNKVNVGEHEDILRKMLLSGDAGIDTEYKIGMIALKDSFGNLTRIMADPETKKLEDSWFAGFLINGIIYYIDLDFENGFIMLKARYLKQSGEMEIPIAEGAFGKGIMSAFGLPDEVVNSFYL
jgi:hypothetical protein